MPAVLTCPNGHEWSSPDSQPRREEFCPHCGSEARIKQETDAGSLTATVDHRQPDWPEIPGHKILGLLGRGGMGVVYKALQVKLGRIVAIKMIGAEAEPESLSRFHLEAQAVASLHHPNIVQIYEIGEANGKPYFSLEFVDGHTLGDRLSGEPQPPHEAARIIEQLARAMHYAHQRSIVHRDLKPSNILLASDGTPKILDFGLAKRLAENSSQTRTGAVMGTPDYMAPEQANGNSSLIGPATDVHALGAILYDMLTGRPPFKGTSVFDTLAMVASAVPVAPRKLHQTVHRDLETICLRCLEKEPRHRYASAEELADELRRFLQSEPVHARRTSLFQRTRRWAARRPAVAALTAAIVVLTASAIGGMAWMSSRTKQKEQEFVKKTEDIKAKSEVLAHERVFELEVPKGLPTLHIPSDNQLTYAKVALGRQLFFDKRLSLDNSVSCASCHDPKRGWSNSQRFATGVHDQVGQRSAPTIVNAAFHLFHFWDGRAGSLEEQALGPIQNPAEMGMTSLTVLEEKLNAISGYRKQFQKVFGSDVTAQNISKAIAAFERTILSGDAPYDRFVSGETSALSESAVRGWNLFFNKAGCSACHAGPNFTDRGFHNIGVGMDRPQPDQGRAAVTGLGGDRGSFKTPTLREISSTAPYMHDGSLATLEAVIEYYNRGGTPNDYLDEDIYPRGLTSSEITDLANFLREGLSSSNYPLFEAPKLP